MSEIEVVLPFAGEDRTFALPLKQLRAVQSKCDAGPSELLRRYVTGSWRIDDVREVLYQGLVGGGMDPGSASRLLVDNFDDRPLHAFVLLAEAVVTAALVGPPGETVGETSGEAQTAPPSPEASFPSPSSTEPAPSSASQPAS